MEWTDEKTRQGGTGFYWFCMYDKDVTHWEHPFIVYVDFHGFIENAYVQRHGMIDRIPLQDFGGIDPEEPNWIGHWYGPLNAPPDKY